MRLARGSVSILAFALSACASHPPASPPLSCAFYGKTSVPGPFLVMNGKNDDGKTCFNISDDTVTSLLESPIPDDKAELECRDPSQLNALNVSTTWKSTLETLYGQGYRITSISRQSITVNDHVVPLPSWTYSLGIKR
jgi:hypothetical protein